MKRGDGIAGMDTASDVPPPVRPALAVSLARISGLVPKKAAAAWAQFAATMSQIEAPDVRTKPGQMIALIVLAVYEDYLKEEFPNYRQLLPETFEHVVTVNRLELLEVVRRTSVLAQRNSPLRLRFAEGELVVSAQTQDVGESRESMPISFAGEPLEIGFNAEFLRDGIDSVEGEELKVNLISPLRPGLLRGAQGDFSYLIMPIRLAG